MELRGTPVIELDGLTVDSRDIEALRAIDEHGSIYQAADALGRSHARIQQRITELEDAGRSLVERTRGGSGGGGSTLTARAFELIASYDRLAAEFSGIARAEESVLSGTVISREGVFGVVDTDAGRVRAVMETGSDAVQVSVRSDAIVVTTPNATPDTGGTSVQNRLAGTVSGIEHDDGIVHVTVDVGTSVPVRTLITEKSLHELSLGQGDEVVVSFKATATRATTHPPTPPDGPDR